MSSKETETTNIDDSSAEDSIRSRTPRPGPSMSVQLDVNVHESFSEPGRGISVLYALSSTFPSQGLEGSPHSVKSDNLMAGDASSSSNSSGRRSTPYSSNQNRRHPQNATPTPAGPPNYGLSAQYHQPRPGFFGQYTMSQQPPPHPPPPIGIPPSSPSYAYGHGYHPDNSLLPQNIHASYQSMIPPPTPVYPYQRHTPEGAVPVSPPMTSPSSAPNPGQFHSSPYPPYSYSASPVYPSQAYYPHHYAPSDVEGQGIWWYLPHAAPNAPSYPGHYYSPVHQELDSNTAYPASPIGGPPLPPSYPVSPIHSPSSSLFRPSPSLGNSPDDTPASPSPAPSPDKPSPAPPVRRPYHPNPPSHRSEWVMWAGNVPSDATHDELWRFFTQAQDNDEPSGVVSIFLISRSSCAFINYETGADLQAAILKFNGVPLRSHDPRCPRLVCRVRKVDDDLKAGVGGQRGVGMHIKWVKDQREKEKEKNRSKTTDPSDQSDIDDTSSSITDPSLSMSSDDSHHRPLAKGRHSGSSGSYASTNSSLLVRHFPKRYFILKSLSQYDLDLSVQKNLWATQKHNEDILDQAYRTSKEVYLIFGVNKSGEFYGYAKMAGPVRQGEQRVSWATRTDSSSSSRSSLSPVTGRPPLSEPIQEVSPAASTSNFFPDREHRLVEDSPAPFTPGQSASSSAVHLPSNTKGMSAPAELGREHHKITMGTPSPRYSLDDRFKQKALSQFHDPTPDNFTLDQSAPFEAMRDERKGGEEFSKFRLKSVQEVEERAEDPEKPETWGESFKVEWICTDRLPFYRTRHLRNPWNHDREVKVSRDGTELEPSVGEQLLGEWQKLIQEKQQQQPQTQTPSEQASGGTGSVAKPPKRSGAGSRLAKETGPPSTSRS